MSGHADPAIDDTRAGAIRTAFRHAGVPLHEEEVAALVRAVQRLAPPCGLSPQQALHDASTPAHPAAAFAAALRRHA
jgi:hypothetical protein